MGLWNLFMPIDTDKGRYGAGLTNLEVRATIVPPMRYCLTFFKSLFYLIDNAVCTDS